MQLFDACNGQKQRHSNNQQRQNVKCKRVKLISTSDSPSNTFITHKQTMVAMDNGCRLKWALKMVFAHQQNALGLWNKQNR